MPQHDATTQYRTQDVNGLKIFYREAGAPTAPTILLLHGFPTSSHMFRDLIPLLAPRYHVIAPDLPGFGFSDAPSPSRFTYTFDRLADVIEQFRTSSASPAMPSISSITVPRWVSGWPFGIRNGSPRLCRRTGMPMRKGSVQVGTRFKSTGKPPRLKIGPR